MLTGNTITSDISGHVISKVELQSQKGNARRPAKMCQFFYWASHGKTRLNLKIEAC